MNSPENVPPDPPLPPKAPVPDTPSEMGPTWEDDETLATLVLRSLFAMLAGGVLLYAQWSSPYSPPSEFWGRWIWTSILFNFIVPLLVVWMFFGQGFVHLDWLKNQKHNAWDYGWNWARWKRYAVFAVVVTAVMAIFMWFASRDPATRLAYNTFLPPTTTAAEWAWVLATLVIYMFCWEWCFRGFLLFGMAQGFGWVVAIAIQAAMFGFAHAGKPPVEFWSSFVGGGALGYICWKEKSFVPAFFVHALVQVVWSIMVRS
ncbi:CPBP family intramembrane metalloprotease [bacterium]|nr:MAG: CPBP family intramembrane metalloprotease [bacterium]